MHSAITEALIFCCTHDKETKGTHKHRMFCTWPKKIAGMATVTYESQQCNSGVLFRNSSSAELPIAKHAICRVCVCIMQLVVIDDEDMECEQVSHLYAL